MSKRIEWLDFCKAVGIILVVLGHVMLGSTISKVYIYGFHMPLFFFLSGIVFDRRKYDFRAFIRRRFDTIIVPYVFFYLITWLYWGLIERHFRPLEMEWWKPLLGLFYGAQWNGFMDHNGILWFLPCLFMVEMLAYNVLGRTDKWWKAVIIVGAFFLVGLLVRNQLPWCLNQAMVCLPFFCAGYAMKRTLLNDELRKYQLIIALVLGVLYLLIQNTTRNEVNIATGVYGNPIIFLTSAFLGTMMLIATCKTLNINQLYDVIGGGIGRNTLVIFALHQPVLRIVRFLFPRLGLSISYQTELWAGLFVTLIVILLLIPIVAVYNRLHDKYLTKLYI